MVRPSTECPRSGMRSGQSFYIRAVRRKLPEMHCMLTLHVLCFKCGTFSGQCRRGRRAYAIQAASIRPWSYPVPSPVSQYSRNPGRRPQSSGASILPSRCLLSPPWATALSARPLAARNALSWTCALTCGETRPCHRASDACSTGACSCWTNGRGFGTLPSRLRQWATPRKTTWRR